MTASDREHVPEHARAAAHAGETGETGETGRTAGRPAGPAGAPDAGAPASRDTRDARARRAERPDLAAIELRGADVLRYLHTVTSQHLSERRQGEATAALLLSPKGKIEHAFRVAVLAGGGETAAGAGAPGARGASAAPAAPVRVVLDTDAAAASDLAERLARFVFRYDVEVGEPIVGGLTLLGEADGAAGEAAVAAGLPPPPDPGGAAEHPGPDGEPGAWVVVHRTRLGLDLVGPGVARIASAPALRGLEAVDADELEALRIAHGIPRWGAELTDDVIAEEAGLLGSHVHLDKGCYPGQETVARVHNLGQVQRRLAGLLVDGDRPPPFRADLKTSDGRRAGQVRSGAVHPVLGPIALAYVRRTVEAGQRLHAGGIDATVVDLPF